MDEAVAKTAGEALAWLGRRAGVDASVTIDAIVMASAARRGDIVYTSDVDDLRRFQPFFPGVEVPSYEAAGLAGVEGVALHALFDAMVEAVEVTAMQRGTERWAL